MSIKRLSKELQEIQKEPPVNCSAGPINDDLYNWEATIIGPKDTPYENGILYFIIEFPHNYPYSPPKVGYLSHSRYRIHPNLYVGRSQDNFLGKVCLSIINTWAGPKWTTIMHVGSVMVSIQSLLFHCFSY